MWPKCSALSTKLDSLKGDLFLLSPRSEACFGAKIQPNKSIEQKDTVILTPRRWQSSVNLFVLWKWGKLDVVMKNSNMHDRVMTLC